MRNSAKLKYIALGAMVALIVTMLVNPVLAALTSKQVTVHTGFNIMMDGERLDLNDANGKPVEAMAYNGSTYVPLYTLLQMFGFQGEYDGGTQTVYLTSPVNDDWEKDEVEYNEDRYLEGTSDVEPDYDWDE